MPPKTANQAESSKKVKPDLDIKRLESITRASIIEALETVTKPLTLSTEDRLAAARMLRGDTAPRVRVSNKECAHLAAFYWRKLKRYAVKNGRRRWTAEQRKLAAQESIRIAALDYPEQGKTLKAGDVLKLVDFPVSKSVKRKVDDVARIELRNTPLIKHFESMGRLEGFGFDLYVRREARAALTASPSN